MKSLHLSYYVKYNTYEKRALIDTNFHHVMLTSIRESSEAISYSTHATESMDTVHSVIML